MLKAGTVLPEAELQRGERDNELPNEDIEHAKQEDVATFERHPIGDNELPINEDEEENEDKRQDVHRKRRRITIFPWKLPGACRPKRII